MFGCNYSKMPGGILVANLLIVWNAAPAWNKIRDEMKFYKD